MLFPTQSQNSVKFFLFKDYSLQQQAIEQFEGTPLVFWPHIVKQKKHKRVFNFPSI